MYILFCILTSNPLCGNEVDMNKKREGNYFSQHYFSLPHIFLEREKTPTVTSLGVAMQIYELSHLPADTYCTNKDSAELSGRGLRR